MLHLLPRCLAGDAMRGSRRHRSPLAASLPPGREGTREWSALGSWIRFEQNSRFRDDQNSPCRRGGKNGTRPPSGLGGRFFRDGEWNVMMTPIPRLVAEKATDTSAGR